LFNFTCLFVFSEPLVPRTDGKYLNMKFLPNKFSVDMQ